MTDFAASPPRADRSVAAGALVLAAGLLGAAAVALAASAAHGGDQRLDTAARMAGAHAPALLGVAALAAASPARLTGLSGALIALGALLFVGDLVARAQLGARLFAMAAPLGGLTLIAGWLALAADGARRLAAASRRP